MARAHESVTPVSNAASAIEIGIGSVEYPDLPLNRILDELARYGLRATELVARRHVTKANVRDVQDVLAKRGVSINSVSAFTKLNEAVHERVQDVQQLIIECIELAAELDAPYTITYFGSNALLNDQDAIARYAEFIQPCLQAAQSSGVHLLIENLFDAVPPEIPATFRQNYRSSDVTRSAKGCLALLEAVGSEWFRLNFDPGNFYVGGEEPYPYAYRLLKPYIANVHLKDAAKFAPEVWGELLPSELQRDLRGDYTCVPIGSGGVNYGALLKELIADGYRGRVILEPHTGPRRLHKTIEDSLTYLGSQGIETHGRE
jgi:sugar phosphate isomerase/epimerase